MHVKTGISVIEYWQAPFPYFRGRGWRSISGDSQQELTSENVALQLSEYALFDAGGNIVITTPNIPGARVKMQADRVYQPIV